MAENIILAFPNRTDVATLSGGAWSPSLPLSNLQNRLLSKVARTTNTDAASTQFNLTFTQPYSARVIGLVNHNLSFSSKWRIRAYDAETSPATTLYDSGWVYAWLLTGTYWSPELHEWEDDNFWYGGYTLEEIKGLTANTFHVIPTVDKTSTMWHIEIVDPDNTDGYVQIGRLFIGPGWQPPINFAYGASLGYETNTGVETSLGDVEFFEPREPLRSMNFTLDALPEGEGYGRALELTRQAGIHREVVVIPDPEDQAQALRRNFLGRLRQLSRLEQPYWQTTSMGFEIKEIR
jgi:hypothetical protein